MTREEAHETDLYRLDIEYIDGQKEFQIGSFKVHKLINKIFDNFESRVCKNCDFYAEFEGVCINGDIPLCSDIVERTFGCNEFERKEKHE